jgi:transglutaminase-like putative cysteine protease
MAAVFGLLPLAHANPSAANVSPNMDILSSSDYTLGGARDLTTNYTYQVDSPTSTYQLSLHIVQPFPYVQIVGTTILTSPPESFTWQNQTDDLGNTFMTITFQSENFAPLGRFYVTVLQHITVYAISYQVDPAKIGSYNTSSPIYRLYTQPAPYIQSDNPEIIAKAKEIAGGESNPYLVAMKIESFVVQHMTYDMAAVTPWNHNTEGALYALASGKGVCRHYSALFTALARADGIPTVDVWGSYASQFGSVVDRGDNKHSWVEFFIPNYGWISADPTENEFAQLDNAHVPEMSVEYTYQRAWSPSGDSSFTSVLGPGLEEPVVSLAPPTGYYVDISGLPNGSNLPNGSYIYLYGSTVNLNIPESIPITATSRYFLEGWYVNGVFHQEQTDEGLYGLYLTVTGNLTLRPSYVKQWFVQVDSNIGSPSGSGWYDDGATATIGVNPPLVRAAGILGNLGVGSTLAGWEGYNLTVVNGESTFQVKSAMILTAIWKTEYGALPYYTLFIIPVLGLALYIRKVKRE